MSNPLLEAAELVKRVTSLTAGLEQQLKPLRELDRQLFPLRESLRALQLAVEKSTASLRMHRYGRCLHRHTGIPVT